jgi:hypothetical protein
MAKATAKKTLSLNQREKLILLPSITSFLWQTKKGEVISGLQLVKWVLEVLKEYTQPKWQQKIVKVALEADWKKVKFM